MVLERRLGDKYQKRAQRKGYGEVNMSLDMIYLDKIVIVKLSIPMQYEYMPVLKSTQTFTHKFYFQKKTCYLFSSFRKILESTVFSFKNI